MTIRRLPGDVPVARVKNILSSQGFTAEYEAERRPNGDKFWTIGMLVNVVM